MSATARQQGWRFETDLAAHGAFWGIVVNAGVTRDNAFPALSDEDWDVVIDTGLNGFYNVVHPLVMPMVRAKKGGRIVTLASVSGVVGNRGQVNYSAAKGGLIAASKALALNSRVGASLSGTASHRVSSIPRCWPSCQQRNC